MNERIQKLAEQATEYANEQNELHGVGYVITFKEKFAQLIVQECLEQIHIQSRGRCGDYHGEWYESDILKHFGVGE